MAGFTRPTTTATPDTLFDFWLPRLRGPELRCLLFIVRRTYGFKKDEDTISLDQFVSGITTRDGRQLCQGTGLRSRASVTAALNSLVAQDLVIKEARRDARNASLPSRFRLHIDDNPAVLAAYGFRPPTTTAVPDELFDHWLPRLSDRELRVLLYVVRHTLGWRKEADTIGPIQFIKGIRRRDGRIVDSGCGLKSVSVVYAALGGLECHALVRRIRQHGEDGSNLSSQYSLIFEGDLPYILTHSTHAMGPDDNADATVDQRPPGAMGEYTLAEEGIHDSGVAGYASAEEGDREDGGRGVSTKDNGGDAGGEGGPSSVENGDHGAGEGDAYRRRNIVRHDEPASSTRPNSQHIYTGHTHPTDTPYQHTPIQQQTQDQETQHQHHRRGVGVLFTDEEILAYPLARDEVFVAEGETGTRPVRLHELVRDDIGATERNWGIRVATECYYSAQHALGIGGDTWTPEEEDKQAHHSALRRDMEALYKDIGALSVDEALASYFTADLVAQLHTDDPDELQRQRAWLRYVRGEDGRNLQNPGGFLRTRLEAGQWPPRDSRRKRA